MNVVVEMALPSEAQHVGAMSLACDGGLVEGNRIAVGCGLAIAPRPAIETGVKKSRMSLCITWTSLACPIRRRSRQKDAPTCKMLLSMTIRPVGRSGNSSLLHWSPTRTPPPMSVT